MKTIKKGQLVLWQGQQCTYEAALSPLLAQIYVHPSKKYVEARVSDLSIVLTSAPPESKERVHLIATPEEWALARDRFATIKNYLTLPAEEKLIAKLASLLSVSIPHCYKLLTKYDENLGAKSLIRSKRGRKSGAKFLDERVESILRTAIDENWKGPGANSKSIFLIVKEICHYAGYVNPSYDTVKERIKSKKKYQLEVQRIGVKAANDIYQARPGRNISDGPLHKWQMDHCVIDCIIVDEKTRAPMCRPWATIIIDVFTRVVVGFYLSIHAPNSYSVAMAITHACTPKTTWLDALGVEISYPYFGKPEQIAMDNAKEFKAKSYQWAADKHGIQLKWRPIGKPWWGGHIERSNRTLAMGHIHFLPGTTLSNVVMKGDYDSSKEACLSFSEFRIWFARELQIYHNTKHRILGVTPHEQWLRGFTRDGVLQHPALISDEFEFMIDFMPEEFRVIDRQGIQLFGISYWSPSLSQYVEPGVKYRVKFNPLSLRQIWVLIKGRYIEANFSDISQPDITLEELNIAKKTAREHGKNGDYDRVKGDYIFGLVKENRALIESSKLTTKRARKVKENKDQGAFFQKAFMPTQDQRTVPIEDIYNSLPDVYDIEV